MTMYAMLRPWLLATRPKTLPAALAPVAAGTALAASVGPWRFDLALGCLVGALLLQIGCNFANDAGDTLRGADTPDRLGPARAVASGLITPRAMLIATALVLTAAALVGAWLASQSGWQLWLLGIASVLASLAYTLGPVPLAYVGLGDLFVLLFFGFAAVLGAAWVQHPAIPPWPWVAIAAAIGLQATALIAINNLRDIPTDARTGKRTMAVRLGDRGTRIYHLALHLAASACFLLGGFPIVAVLAALGGTALALLVWRSSGRSLNRCLGLAALLQLVSAAGVVGCLARAAA
jgi:1,4-dihydroxy-2-naphthoate polyprenyltransferase